MSQKLQIFHDLEKEEEEKQWDIFSRTTSNLYQWAFDVYLFYR